ncbi:hypothetical protein AAHC03_04570 [Spirometra sp. Aus1]|nr:unnamed protein product [Spirometra erinaceieuropaei]
MFMSIAIGKPSSINSLVKCAGSLQDACVLEVGPGPGSLTRAILRQRPRHLVVVELDRRFLPALQELQVSAAEIGVRMDIYRGDILKMNTEDIFPVDAIYWPDRWGSGVENLETGNYRQDQLPSTDSTALTESSDSPTTRPPRIRILVA